LGRDSSFLSFFNTVLMEKALNDSNESIRPAYTGQRAVCEICKSVVISKCGAIYPYHWAHKNNEDCDPWYEPKTAWHKKWQDYFPDYQQEITINKNNILHRADILTEQGIVIEIQNSPITAEVIKEREDFYQEIIWVVNGVKFLQNVQSENILKKKLVRFDNETTFLKRRNPENNNIIELIRRIRLAEDENYRFKSELEIKQKLINNLTIQLDNIDIYVQKFKNFQWDPQTYFPGYSINKTFDSFKTTRKEFKDKMYQYVLEINTYGDKLKKILDLPKREINGILYHEVIFSLLDTAKFKNIKALLKTDYNSVFPNYISFNTELEISTKQYNNNLVYFFDFKDIIQENEPIIIAKKCMLDSISIEFEKLYFKLKTDAINEINETITLVKRDIKTINKKIEIRTNLILKLGNEKQKLEIKDKIERDKNLIEILKNRATDREKIINEYKGIYRIYWKWERLAWRAATKPVYFDFGYDFILQRIDEDLYKKVEIKDFLELHISDYAVSNPNSFAKTAARGQILKTVQTTKAD